MTDKNAAAEGAAPFEFTFAEPESWKRVIGVTIATPYFEDEYARQLRVARKTHERPGFRKGKVPLAMVERDLGPEVRMQALEAVVPRAYQAAVVDRKLVPVADPSFENLKMDEGEPITLDIVVQVRPEVEAVGYDDLPLTLREPKVGDAEVDETVDQLRESKAVTETVERAGARGDVLKVDVTPLDAAGEPEPDKMMADYALELGAKGNLPVFDEGLDGAAAGETREITATYPDDYPGEELRGRIVTYRIAVKEVQQRLLPEADDAFAASLKEGQTLLELRTAIRDDLQAELDRRAERETREEILDRLLERNPVDLPPALIDDFVESGLGDFHRRNQYQGRPNTAEGDAEYRRQARPAAERALHGMLVLESVQRQEKIEVADADVDERIDEIAATNGFELEQYRAYVNQGEERRRIAHDLAETRTYDFLKSRADFTGKSAKKDKGAAKNADQG